MGDLNPDAVLERNREAARARGDEIVIDDDDDPILVAQVAGVVAGAVGAVAGAAVGAVAGAAGAVGAAAAAAPQDPLANMDANAKKAFEAIRGKPLAGLAANLMQTAKRSANPETVEMHLLAILQKLATATPAECDSVVDNVLLYVSVYKKHSITRACNIFYFLFTNGRFYKCDAIAEALLMRSKSDKLLRQETMYGIEGAAQALNVQLALENGLLKQLTETMGRRFGKGVAFDHEHANVCSSLLLKLIQRNDTIRSVVKGEGLVFSKLKSLKSHNDEGKLPPKALELLRRLV